MKPKKIMKVKEPEFKDIRDWFDENLDAEKCDLDDQLVYENVYHEGKWAAVFQFTERGAQKFAMEAKPRSIVDLATVTSIYRPGPLMMNAHKMYVSNREKMERNEELDYIHPIIKGILDESKGLMSFQEQFMIIGRELGDLSWEDCDKLRKILVKKSIGTDVNEEKQRQADQLKEKFRVGANAKGVTDEQVNELWEAIAAWSGYGFNKCLEKSTQVTVIDPDTNNRITLPIHKVRSGMRVMSRDEATQQDVPVDVVKVHDNGPKDLFEYEFEGGERVVCTPDHKFRTTDGRMLPIHEIIDQGLGVICRL